MANRGCFESGHKVVLKIKYRPRMPNPEILFITVERFLTLKN